MQQTMKVISDTNIIDSARLNARLFFTPTCCSVVLTTSVAPSITPKYVPRNDFDIATTATIIPEIDSHAGAFGSIESADKMVTFFFSRFNIRRWNRKQAAKDKEQYTYADDEISDFHNFFAFIHSVFAIFSRLSMANVEIMGVWLKAKTITGIDIHIW